MSSYENSPIESDIVIEILFKLVAQYDGYHAAEEVKKQMRSSIPYKELIEYVNTHYDKPKGINT